MQSSRKAPCRTYDNEKFVQMTMEYRNSALTCYNYVKFLSSKFLHRYCCPNPCSWRLNSMSYSVMQRKRLSHSEIFPFVLSPLVMHFFSGLFISTFLRTFKQCHCLLSVLIYVCSINKVRILCPSVFFNLCVMSTQSCRMMCIIWMQLPRQLVS